MSGLCHSIAHTVVPYEGDGQGALSLPMLFQLMLLSSGDQARQLGVADAAANQELLWVIVQNEVRFERPINVHETIRIETEALSYNTFFSYRAYRIFDHQQQLCAQALTTFALLDKSRRKLTRVPASQVAPYQAEPQKQPQRLRRLTVPHTPPLVTQTYRARVLDIDSNQHVNNTKYFEWMLDVMGQEFYRNHRLAALAVSYEREVHYRQTVTVRAYALEQKGDCHAICYQLTVDDNSCCVIHATWLCI